MIRKITLSSTQLRAIQSLPQLTQPSFQKDVAFVFRCGHLVIKIFNPLCEKSSDCITVLSGILHEIDIDKLPNELIKPTALLFLGTTCIGYAMPYSPGKTLGYLLSHNLGLAELNQILNTLAHVLLEFPPRLCAGDLHPDNIIIFQGKPLLIDLDGFTLHGYPRMSCPLDSANISHLLWHHQNGIEYPSKVTDILCLISIYLGYISGGYSVFRMEPQVRNFYLHYLNQISSMRSIISTIHQLFSQKTCPLPPPTFGVRDEDLCFTHFSAFSRTQEYQRLINALELIPSH